MLPRSSFDEASQRGEVVEWFVTFYATFPDPALLHDDDSVLAVNDAFARLVALPREALCGASLRSLADEVTFSRFAKMILSHDNAPFEVAMPVVGGSVRIGEFHSRAIGRAGDGLFLLSIRDVTDRHQAVAALQESEARFRSLVQKLAEIIIVFDAAGSLKYANPALERVLGYAPTSYAAGLRLELVHPDDLDHVNSAWELVLASPDRSVDVIYRARSADGRWIWLDTVLTNHLDDPAIEGVVYNASDVTEQKRLEMDLRHLALHDPLTGLSNRVRFNDRLAERIRRLAVSDHPAAVLFLDLDRFKIVNDTLGHAVGDSLLQALVERIQSALAPQDLLARFGGDEFVAILDHVSDENGAFEVADRVIAALERPFEWNGHRLIVGSSIGVAMVRPGRTPDQVLRDADTALYHAKSAGRGRAVLYTEELMSQSGRRHRIGAELRRAVERAELFLEYQPIVRLSDQACIAHEALARWRHPEFGAISPAEFIPIAEETGAIEPIGAWIIDDACRRLAAWTPDGAVISLNLSAVQMRNSALAPQILSCLEAHRIDPARLQIELTESTLIDDLDQACATLERLRHHGVSVAIDDFGSGYSSLLYLRDLPIDSIKLDCRFIQGIGTRAGSVAIIEAIVALAHTLGLSVTGEGIETAEQLEFLRGIGCDAGQGYYLGRPALPGQRPPQSVSLPSSAEQSDPWAFPRVPRIVVPSARP